MDDQRFEVKHPEIEKKLKEIGGGIQASLPPGWGFTLFLEEHAPGETTFYLSSMERLSMTKGLHEFIERQTENDPHCGSCGCPAAHWPKNDDGRGYKT